MSKLDTKLVDKGRAKIWAQVCDLANRSQISRVIGCLALLGDSLLADKPVYKMLLEKLGMTHLHHPL